MHSFEVEAFGLDAELVDAFYEELERLAGELQAGLDTSDKEAIRLAAHSIKGMCGTMGLPEISVLAQEIEITLREGILDRSAQLSTALIFWALDFLSPAK